MIKDVVCKNLTAKEFEDIELIFLSSFNGENANSAIKHYADTTDNVLIMYDAEKPISFLFYQLRKIHGVNVLHFSLSGKNTTKSGTQKKMGAYLFYKHILTPVSALKLNVFVTVSNNPRSYFNMRSFGATVFPDVLSPEKPFKYAALYQKIAYKIGLSEVEPNGVLRNRMQKLGFQILEEQTREDCLDKKGMDFMKYIDYDASHGVLVMCCIRPIIDVPSFYLSEAAKSIKNRSLQLLPILKGEIFADQ